MASRRAKSNEISIPRQKRPAATYRYQPGMVIGPFTLLDIAVWDRNISKRKWWVVYNCCGREAIRSYCTISNGSAGIRTPGRCIDCERQARGASGVLRRTPLIAEAITAEPRPPRLLPSHPGDAWPRPPSLAGSPPGPWADNHS